MATPVFGTDVLAWSVLFLYCLRFIIACACVLCSMNMRIVLRYTVQMQVGSKAGPSIGPRRMKGLRRHEQSHSAEQPTNDRLPKNNTPESRPGVQMRLPLRNQPLHHQPPPPYSIDPPKTDSKVHPESVMQLYENIMLADAETIKVQQETLEAQQELLRSQAHIVQQMRGILEAQDAQIAQLEETIVDLRDNHLSNQISSV